MMSSFTRIVLAISLLATSTDAFSPTFVPASSRHASSSTSLDYQVVLLRHGESTWNNENKFTGWHDCPLSPKGEGEAKQGGELMAAAGLKFTKAYTSKLTRAQQTLKISMEASGQAPPTVEDYR